MTSTAAEGSFADASERRLKPHVAGLPFMARSAMNDGRVTRLDVPLYEAAHTKAGASVDFTVLKCVFASKVNKLTLR
jgi:hypothetical protein